MSQYSISNEIEESKDRSIDFAVCYNDTKTNLKTFPGITQMFNNGKINDSSSNLAFMKLPDCYRIIKLDWISSKDSDSVENYIWILYITINSTSNVAIIKLEHKDEKIIKCKLSYIAIFTDDKLDIDCIGSMNEKDNVLAMFSVITSNNKISFYNFPIDSMGNQSDKTIPCIKFKEALKSLDVPKGSCKQSWNNQNPNQIAIADSKYNIYIIDIEEGEIILKYHHTHTMEITKILWINYENSKDSFIVTSSHDGNIKFWDLKNPFAPSFVHSIGQRWIYDIEWDPLLNVLHYNSEGKGNSYSCLVFYGTQPPILKKYAVPSQATLVLSIKIIGNLSINSNAKNRSGQCRRGTIHL